MPPATMDISAVGTLFTSTLTSFGGQVLVVLTGILGLTLAVFLFWYVVRHIKGSL